MVAVGFACSQLPVALDKALTGQLKRKVYDAFRSSTSTHGDEIKAYRLRLSRSLIARLKGQNCHPPVGHMPYLPNLASPRDDVHARSVQPWQRRLVRCLTCDTLYFCGPVIHLGSHSAKGTRWGWERIVRVRCGPLLDKNKGVILLENSPGSRNSMGKTPSLEMARLMEATADGEPASGRCTGHCHLFAAGYDLRTPAASEYFRQVRRRASTFG